MSDAFPPHADWLLHHQGELLEQRAHDQDHPVGARKVIQAFLDADPDPRKRALQWLANVFLTGGFFWEDVADGAGSKVAETLRWFARYRGRISPGRRRLEAYDTLAAVYQAVTPFLTRADRDEDEDEDGSDDEKGDEEDDGLAALVAGFWGDGSSGGSSSPSKRDIKRDERERARRESLILWEDARLTVAIPMTLSASQWWGRGTRWCTAAKKSLNWAFEHYDQHGPLVVIILDGAKFQMHVPVPGSGRKSVQFADAADESLTRDSINANWPVLGPILAWAVSRNGSALRHVPFRYAGLPQFGPVAVKTRGGMLKLLPVSAQTHAAMWDAVGNDGTALADIEWILRPWIMLTRSMVWALRPVPGLQHAFIRRCRLNRLHMRAVSQNSRALALVPRSMRTYEVCMAACSSGLVSPDLLDEVPRRHWTRDLLTIVARGNRNAMHRVWQASAQLDPDVLASAEMAAVEHAGLSLLDVPVYRRTRRLCLSAVRKDGQQLEAVPAELRDMEMAMAAITCDGAALAAVPDDLRTVEVCRLAVASAGRALRYVPFPVFSEELCLLALGQHRDAFRYIPERFRTVAVCREVMRYGRTPDINPALKGFTTEVIEEARQHQAAAPAPAPAPRRQPDPVAETPKERLWNPDSFLEGLVDACRQSAAASRDTHVPPRSRFRHVWLWLRSALGVRSPL